MSFQRNSDEGYSLQNDLKILAALSLSLSRVVGQKASLPIRFDSLFTGAPSLSAHPHTLSNPLLLCVLVLSQDGNFDVTFCIVNNNRMNLSRLIDQGDCVAMPAYIRVAKLPLVPKVDAAYLSWPMT